MQNVCKKLQHGVVFIIYYSSIITQTLSKNMCRNIIFEFSLSIYDDNKDYTK